MKCWLLFCLLIYMKLYFYVEKWQKTGKNRIKLSQIDVTRVLDHLLSNGTCQSSASEITPHKIINFHHHPPPPTHTPTTYLLPFIDFN